ncbi:tryptophan synthase subunit beta [Gammaproteobacteria bacterium]
MTKNFVNKQGKYARYGGTFLPEVLMAPMKELVEAFAVIGRAKKFQNKLSQILTHYAGRPTPLTEVANFSKSIRGPKIYLKREDLLHTGAHKINNALGQCLLAREMSKTRIIAETGAGQHGVATATACAYLGLDCVVYMGSVDIERQSPNVTKMKLLGAEVISVTNGSQTLKDAINEAMRDYAANFATTHYCIGSALGPHPYPEMVHIFQSIIGLETKKQCHKKFAVDPDAIIACVGGGSNAIGIFSPFIDMPNVRLIGVEAGGLGNKPGQHAARFLSGKPGVLHGCYSYVLQDSAGQISATHSVSAGLDYPSVGPLHAALFDQKRVLYTSVKDKDAIAALILLARTEGIIPALESAHALGYLLREASRFNKNDVVIVNLSGRGDKDLPQLAAKGLI